jgi:hypothetical protein
MEGRLGCIGLLSAALALGCQDGLRDEPPPPVDQRPVATAATAAPTYANRADVAAQMRTASARTHHPADGSGRAWIADGPKSVTANSAARWQFTYEAGAEGIADGGAIIFMVSPFWGWSPPQDENEAGLGYASAATDAPGVTLALTTNMSPMMALRVGGRGLEPGERVSIHYGGAASARTDRFAESRSHFWIGVDGDGDGSHRFLSDSPTVEVTAGPAARLVAVAPSTVRPGEPVVVRVSALDRLGNAGTSLVGSLRVESEPQGATPGQIVAVGEADRGTVAITVAAPAEGVFRLLLEADGGLQARSNPIVVAPSGPRIYWGDLHGHSGLSDGTGTPEDYLRYARDVAALDIVALTDHDHWGVFHLDENPAIWEQIQTATKEFHRSHSFVTLLGYEWTSWESGHRHVLYFSDEGKVYSSIDPAFDTPQKLWAVLRGADAITMAHHSAGGPIATDWSIPPDPVLEPVTEVVSVHGVSEAADSPSVIYDAKPGNFVRDVIERGYRFGFVGSGDSHDGHPGLSHLSSGGTGGVAAILADELTRPAVLDALRRRRVYATSGPRIYLRTALSAHPMGSTVAARDLGAADEPLTLYIHAIGTDTIRWIDVVRGGTVVRSEVGQDEIELLIPFAESAAGDYVYVRVVQDDGGLAWSSPIFVE